MNTDPICPCEGFEHPSTIANRPGQDAIAYRVGDFASFRRALLLPLTDEDDNVRETELTNWHPTPDDLALQMAEWWAYLADILTFYSERIANASYLRTADLPEHVQRLIRVLGYRPRPGIGAQGVVAALLTKPTPLTLPQGFQVQSKPGPGKQPQLFELDADTPVKFPDVVEAELPPNPALLIDQSVLVSGTITTIKPGERLLLLEKGWSSSNANYALVTVQQVQPEPDPRGKPNTRITFVNPPNLTGNPQAANYRLLKSTQSVHVWQYPAETVITDSQVDLDSLVRQIAIGDPILFEASPQTVNLASNLQLFQDFSTAVLPITGIESPIRSASTEIRALSSPTLTAATIAGEQLQSEVNLLDLNIIPGAFLSTLVAELVSSQLASVTGYTEVLWYANPDNKNPDQLPISTEAQPKIPIPILHTRLFVKTPPDAPSLSQFDSDSQRKSLEVRYGFQEVGVLIGTPATTVIGTATPKPDQTQLTLYTVGTAKFPSGLNQAVLLEDANGQGVVAKGDVATSTSSVIQLTIASSPATLASFKPPLRVLFNPLSLSRGQTVASEILGSGDASVPGQEFVLKQAPLTYLLSSDSSSGSNYTSTLRIWVNGVEWREVPSFYSQPADARVFVTHEDEEHLTHVLFGDGINGARLPSGFNNLVARYRYGSGADSPNVGSLSVIVKPYPNLKAIRNPVAVGGGADPEPAEKIRRYAPRSVLTFGRAVSGDDYETIAAQAPGVARARAYWTWDANLQRTLVKLYVGDDDNAKQAAIVALAGAADPNRPVEVVRAIAISLRLILAVRLDPAYLPEPVLTAVRDALLHPETGLFGIQAVQIGRSVYRSQIYATCLRVPGVLAVPKLKVYVNRGDGFKLDSSHRHDPGEGGFFRLEAEDLLL